MLRVVWVYSSQSCKVLGGKISGKWLVGVSFLARVIRLDNFELLPTVLTISSFSRQPATLFADSNDSKATSHHIHPTVTHTNYPRLPRGPLDPLQPAPKK